MPPRAFQDGRALLRADDLLARSNVLYGAKTPKDGIPLLRFLAQFLEDATAELLMFSQVLRAQVFAEALWYTELK